MHMITSLKGNQMIERISPVYAQSGIEQAIYEAIGMEFDITDNLGDEVLLQLFPQSATWGLVFWEQRVKLPTNLNEDLGKRRRKVISKMQTRHPLNPARMANILSSYTNTNVYIDEDTGEDFVFNVVLTSKEFFDINVDEIIKQTKRIKPSHLGFRLALQTVKDIGLRVDYVSVLNPLQICGDFYCGDGLVTATIGRVYESNLNVKTVVSDSIKDYDLTGDILASNNTEFEKGIAVIGRVFEAIEKITSAENHLFDSELSKSDGFVIGSSYIAKVNVNSSADEVINDYEQCNASLTGEFLVGSNIKDETTKATLGRLYESTEQIKSTEAYLLDNQLNKNSELNGAVVGSYNECTLETKIETEDNTKNYDLAGSILASENINGEKGDTTIAKVYTANIQENLNIVDILKEYKITGEFQVSEEEKI